ncbi:MAG: type II secretion system F family protein [Thermoguttaceae bacterium]|jgi:tight adherence protein B|nr:type II secretion system F family protein [Thermoguttaceae bacterium]
MSLGADTWLASVLMGTAVGWGYFSLRGQFTRALDAVENDLAEKLRRLRASTRGLRRWIVFWLMAVAAVFFTFWLLLDNLVFGALGAVFLMAGPWWLVRRMAERRRRRIEDQLADAMVTLANAVRAGLSLAQALEILAAQCPKPLSEEFRQIVGEYNLGKPLEQTLREAKARLKSENFALFAAAILASHESGGRLNETVERIASSVLEMQRLERKVQSETAQARKSAVYMALAPALILLVYYFVDPENTVLLFTIVPGQILLAVAVVLNVIAYFWAQVILRPNL